MKNKIINGVVFRDNKKLLLISFFDDSVHQIYDKFYFSSEKDNTPLKETTLVLVHFEKLANDTYTTHPIVDFDIKYQKKSVVVKLLDIDTIVNSSFTIAKLFLRDKKEYEDSLEHVVDA